MQKSKILIVDDTRAGRETLEELLFSPAYDLHFACNGTEALEEAAKVVPDLVLLDVMMPDMNGFEVCQILRKNPRLAEVPVIMITALDDSESRLEGIEAGADDFISKPFDGAELRARVRTITRLNRYRRLHQERSKFEWVIERSEDGYITVGDDDVIRYANTAAKLYLGLKEDHEKGGLGVFTERVKAQHQLQPEKAWAEVLAGKSAPPDTPLFLIRPPTSGSGVLWLEVTPFDCPTGAAGEKLLRIQNVSSQVLAQREMWGFHSRISHKLRTPLNGIVGLAGELAESAGKLSAQEVATLSGTIHQAAQTLSNELTDILQFMRLPALSRFGEKMAFDELPEMISSLSEELKVKVQFTPPAGDLASRRLDISSRGLAWALRELFENSLKYHPTHSPLVEVFVESKAENWAVIGVRDDGRALTPDMLSKAFIPYYQGDRSNSGMAEGMGLGLALVASVIWEAKGTCTVHNREDGPGLVVEILLPVHQ